MVTTNRRPSMRARMAHDAGAGFGTARRAASIAARHRPASARSAAGRGNVSDTRPLPGTQISRHTIQRTCPANVTGPIIDPVSVWRTRTGSTTRSE
jgi:hypothetical protein